MVDLASKHHESWYAIKQRNQTKPNYNISQIDVQSLEISFKMLDILIPNPSLRAERYGSK